MTGISAQAGRIRRAAAGWQEDRYRRSGNRQQQADIYRQRMTCSDSLRFDTQSQDWTGGMGISPSGRFQVVEEDKTKGRLFSAEGIRWREAWLCIIAVCVLCLGILLADVAGIGSGSKALAKLDNRIAEMTAKNDELRAAIAYSAEDISVCTEAVKLNLVSGSGVRTIILTAPQDAIMTISASNQR